METFQWSKSGYPAPRPFASFGANNHSGPCDADYLATGMKRTRLDCAWWQVEKIPGTYDLAWAGSLIRPYVKSGVTPLVILASNNPAYYTDEEKKILAVQDRPWCPYDVGYALDARREALWVNYAYNVIVAHAGFGIDWEMMNEIMDRGFWHNLDGSQPTTAEQALVYTRIVKALCVKLQGNRNTRGEKLVVGVSYGNFDFLEAIFQQNILILPNVRAVSFHAYQPKGVPPEAVAKIWQALRTLIDQYAAGRFIPIISSEWGYDEESCDPFMSPAQVQYLASLLPATAATDASDAAVASAETLARAEQAQEAVERTRIRQEIQADLMMRTFKTNFACANLGVAYSIWYRYPGADQTFGMLDPQGRKKPTYAAMKELHDELASWGLAA